MTTRAVLGACLLCCLLPLSACQKAGSMRPDGLAFPVPSGWTVMPVAQSNAAAASSGAALGTSSGADASFHLHDASGACAIRFSRTFSQMSLDDWTNDLAASFAKSGHAPQVEPAMSLGGAPAKHLFLQFPNGLIEQVYTLRSGDDLLTLVTVHAAQCKSDFQDTLDAFRA